MSGIGKAIQDDVKTTRCKDTEVIDRRRATDETMYRGEARG